jgi:hypothetical protein
MGLATSAGTRIVPSKTSSQNPVPGGFHTFKRFFGSLCSYELDGEKKKEKNCAMGESADWWHLKSQGAQMILISILIFFGF